MCVLSAAVLSRAVVYVRLKTHKVIHLEAPSPGPTTPQMPLPSVPIDVMGIALLFLIWTVVSSPL